MMSLACLRDGLFLPSRGVVGLAQASTPSFTARDCLGYPICTLHVKVMARKGSVWHRVPHTTVVLQHVATWLANSVKHKA